MNNARDYITLLEALANGELEFAWIDGVETGWVPVQSLKRFIFAGEVKDED